MTTSPESTPQSPDTSIHTGSLNNPATRELFFIAPPSLAESTAHSEQYIHIDPSIHYAQTPVIEPEIPTEAIPIIFPVGNFSYSGVNDEHMAVPLGTIEGASRLEAQLQDGQKPSYRTSEAPKAATQADDPSLAAFRKLGFDTDNLTTVDPVERFTFNTERFKKIGNWFKNIGEKAVLNFRVAKEVGYMKYVTAHLEMGVDRLSKSFTQRYRSAFEIFGGSEKIKQTLIDARAEAKANKEKRRADREERIARDVAAFRAKEAAKRSARVVGNVQTEAFI